MPYRLTPDKKGVQKKEGKRWKTLKRYNGKDAKTKARKYLQALVINSHGK